MPRFFSIGFDSIHPAAGVEVYLHGAEVSLDDADFILFSLPSAPYEFINRDLEILTYNGKPLLGDDNSFQYKDLIKRWKGELVSSVTRGKTVFIFLTSIEQIYVATDERKRSGTGRNMKVNRIVDELSNLEVLPCELGKVVPGVGNEIRSVGRSRLLNQYWNRFASMSRYNIRFAQQKWLEPLLTTKNPDQVVSALVKCQEGGHLVLLPEIELGEPEYFEYPDEDDLDDEDEMSSEQQDENIDDTEFRVNSIDFIRQLRNIDAQLSNASYVPPPDWVQITRYETLAQHNLRKDLLKAQEAEDRARELREQLLASLEEASILQGLLYAQGRQLETAVIRALELMGVEAAGVAEDDSEFDAMFTIDGRRMLGEVEGRDNSAIAIGKITQLERNIAEDFARDGVNDYAHGVLFGNPERLVAPDKRTKQFTEKCIASAVRNRFGLVLTHQMFDPAAYLEASNDADYAAECRSALVAAEGCLVEFPSVPTAKDSASESVPASSDANASPNA